MNVLISSWKSVPFTMLNKSGPSKEFAILDGLGVTLVTYECYANST